MPKPEILVAWIGHTDLRAMAMDLPEVRKQRLLDQLPKGPRESVVDGPIKTLVTKGPPFAAVHLLSDDFSSEWAKEYQSWLGGTSQIHQLDLADPTDYAAIYAVADERLDQIVKTHGSDAMRLNLHLSPGTPAMAAIWVLLGKSKYPARFWQTYRGEAKEALIPFDLTVDFLPQALRSPDIAFHHLTLHSPREVAGFENIVGTSPEIRLATGRAKRAALRSAPVLLLGESGTGKELFALAIHAASPRKHGPFTLLLDFGRRAEPVFL